MTDERKDKLSGSGFGAYAACVGRFQLERTLPEPPPGPYAESGNRIHDYLATGKGNISTEELETAAKCRQEYEEILSALPVSTKVENSIIEDRLWYKDLYSGQIDRIDLFEGGKTALMVDWKTGRNPVGHATENLQLRAYATLVHHNHPEITKMFVAIVQPLATKFTIAEYDQNDLEMAERQILAIAEAAYAPNPTRTPSPDACKYCRAKSICPEAQGVANELAVTPVVSVPALTNDQIGDYLDKAQVVEDFIEALRAEAKNRMKSGAEIPGYNLGNGRTSRSIEDTQAVYDALASTIGQEGFATACKVSLPSLEKVFAEAKGLKAKEAKAELENILGNLIATKTSEPIMVRTK